MEGIRGKTTMATYFGLARIDGIYLPAQNRSENWKALPMLSKKTNVRNKAIVAKIGESFMAVNGTKVVLTLACLQVMDVRTGSSKHFA